MFPTLLPATSACTNLMAFWSLGVRSQRPRQACKHVSHLVVVILAHSVSANLKPFSSSPLQAFCLRTFAKGGTLHLLLPFTTPGQLPSPMNRTSLPQRPFCLRPPMLPASDWQSQKAGHSGVHTSPSIPHARPPRQHPSLKTTTPGW